MKIFSKKFYFFTLLLVIIVATSFAFFDSQSLKNNEEKMPALQVQETPKNITVNKDVNQNIVKDIKKDVTPSNTTTKNKTPVPLSVDKKILATLVKENLPENIADLRFIHLDVPVFKQEYIRSCEEASLRMVLAFYGITSNDMEIVKRVGYNPHQFDAPNNIWDDPNEMFVGYISDPKKSGYGAFASAIAAAAKTFGRDSESYLGVSGQFLAEQIYNGNPVIVWGFTSSPPFTKYYWSTKTGKKVSAYRGEHARVVVGVYGDPSDPVGFLLNDPLTGEKDQYWSTSRLLAHMNAFGDLTNQAVVVR